MPSDKRQSRLVTSLAVIAVICAVLLPCKSGAADDNSLWGVYEQALKGAKYVDLTHTITPNIPVNRVCRLHLRSGQSRCRHRRICQDRRGLHLREARI
jgi:hypothetical protein